MLVLQPIAAHAEVRPKREAAIAPDSQARRVVLSKVRSWAYQLRINDLAPLIEVDADLIVVDHGFAARHQGKTMFDATDVAKLKIKPDGSRRIVLAYMSIGEAEQYRFYWQAAWCSRATAPSWVGAVNPSWPGNYPARFWDQEWQHLIVGAPDGYLARIQAQGFDGVYLDRTDVYAEWLKERPKAEQDMIAFLARIAGAARDRDPGFLVVLQNAEELLTHRAVRQLLDGVAKEDLLYGEAFSDTPNEADAIANARKNLQRARADQMPVFAVEYLADADKIAGAREKLLQFGFVPYFAPRLLDRLVPQPGAVQTPPGAQVLPSPLTTPSAAARGPTTTPPSVTAMPGPSWAEGGPTCLLD